ncbi:putative phytosulfokines 6 isoform X2 [Primulina tabacum]|uniref:putative phytosulfokines 6 isoform X2 n=1 Tax=Primulina tabacum TaxID=48773 RepID=UPI003F5A2733
MNRHFHVMIALIFLLVSFTTIPKYSARELAPEQGEVNVKMNNVVESQESVTKMKGFDSFDILMGLEEINSCEGRSDEEDCSRRRDVLEAHLDYIYTQQHKP